MIVQKKEIAPSTFAINLDAPLVAKKARAGQFVVVLVDERIDGKKQPARGLSQDLL
jgi:ferredoxin--NADP+ reductase